MKAAILVKQHASLVVADVEIPPLNVGQVLVRVKCTAICGKQLDEISGKRGDDLFLPHLLGHEGAGIVEDVGPGVSKVRGGEHVVLHWMKGSGIDSAPPRFRWNGAVVSAGWVTTFSEYTIVSENRLTSIPDDVPFDAAALLGCAVTTGLGIVFNNAALRPGQSIAVFGAGGVGLNVVQGATLVNAYPVVAIDIRDAKLEQATRFGATHTLGARHSDPAAALSSLSEGRGFDVVVDTTGDTGVIRTAYDATNHAGRTILAGVPHHQGRITIDSFPLHFGRAIIGVHGGDTKPDSDIPRYLQLYRLGRLKLEELITHHYTLDRINDAVERMREGETGRCVIVMP